MAQGTIALLMICVGAALVIAVPRLGSAMAKAIAVRLAAIAFLGAGLNLTGGWIGDGARWIVDTATDLGNQATGAAFGTAAIWVLWAGVVVVWIAGMVPEKWFRFEIPDWLSASGVLLPLVPASIPGSFGETETRIVTGWFS